MQSVSVKGEISNCKYHSSGHIYFTLKDENGMISCVMFANYGAKLTFRLVDGQQVIVNGSLVSYEKAGKYELLVKKAEPDGTGNIYEKLEQLKKKLAEQGMFDPCYKRKIPAYISKLGVVTAETGAAVRDILQVSGRRNPYVQIIVFPSAVQGEQAAQSIVNGIRALERLSVDVIIIGRGGGSAEELWAFNEEIVAQAVFDCKVPIISAVGHETDMTLTDYVADLRVPTPSAAAEMAVYEYDEFRERMDQYERNLNRTMRRRIDYKKLECRKLETQIRSMSPLYRLREQRLHLISIEERISENFRKQLAVKKYRLGLDIEKLKGLSPLDKLQQGYSYVTDKQGKNIRRIGEVQKGDTVSVRLSDGCFYADVTGKESK